MKHRVSIETTTSDPFYPGHPGYVAECDICGQLQEPVAEPRLAHRAINRHLRELDGAPA